MSTVISDSLEALARDWSAVPYSSASEKFVLGDIRLNARVLLVGEAPGEDEDNSVTPDVPLGQAFVGRAGQRLDYTLSGVGLPRSEVSVANVMPRRPLDARAANREPTKDEIRANAEFVWRLVRLHPDIRVVGLMGGTALEWRSGVEKIKSYRGDEFFDQGLWWVPTYHPAAVLHQPSNLKWFVQDLEWIRTLADGNLLDLSELEVPYVDDGVVLRMRYFSDIAESPLSYFDVETAAEPPAQALWWWDPRVRPVLVSLAWLKDGRPNAVVVEVNDTTVPVLRDLFVDGRVEHWAGQSLLYYDIPLLERRGMPVWCRRSVIDSYPIARLNDENRGCGLKDLGKRHLRTVNYTPWWGDDAGKAWQQRWIEWPSMSTAERAERIAYSGKDAWVGIQVAQIEAERLKRTSNLVKAYKDLAVWQARAVVEMNGVGLPLDMEAAITKALSLTSEMAEIDQRLQAVVPDEARKPKKARRRKGESEPPVEYEPANFGSHVQVSRMLFQVAGLPKVKTTPTTGQESTDVFALLRVLGARDSLPDAPGWAFDVIEGVLARRRLEKTKGYVEALIDAASLSHDGRVHSTFKAGPVTWRIASEDPNCQQFPGDVKELIVAPEGWTFVKYDVCLAPETRILKSDLTWARADSLRRGDEIVAFDEEPESGHPRGKNRGRRFRPAVVEAISSLTQPTFEILTDRGTVRASGLHQWLAERRTQCPGKWQGRKHWVRSQDLSPGDEIAFLESPWPTPDSRDAGWMGGFLDGEGSINGHTIQFAQNPNRALDEAIRLLAKWNVPYSLWKRRPLAKPHHIGAHVLSIPSLRASLRLFGMAQPKRLNSRKMWDDTRIWGRRTEVAKVLAIRALGPQSVLGIRTSTKTLIAEGMLSHNSGLEVGGLADQAPEQKLISRIRGGEDLHWRHTCGMMSWEYDSVPKDADGKPVPQTDLQKQTRKAIKTLFFASGYQAGPNRLADTLREDFHKIGVGLDVVAEILTARNAKPGRDPFRALAEIWLKWLDAEYPALKRAFRRIAAETAKRGYVRGKFHIERRLPEIRDYDDAMRMEAERQAYNFTPQNLSCLTFLAYRELWQIRRDMELEDSIFLAVQEHDSKVWLCREEVAGLWAPVVKHVMETPDFSEWNATFLVPIRVEGAVDKRWH